MTTAAPTVAGAATASQPTADRVLRWFLRALGGTLLLRVGVDAYRGAWDVHADRLFPWRHLPGIPLYPTWGLALEWVVIGGAGIALVLGARTRWAVMAALLGTLASLTQRFSNQQALQLIVVFFVALDPLAESTNGNVHTCPNYALLRKQLWIVYGFSALHKLRGGFLGGATAGALLGVSHPIATVASWLVVLAELSLPVLLWRTPRIGILGVIVFHASLAALLPGVLPFSATMITLSILFLKPSPSTS